MATTPVTGANGAWSLYRQCAMTSRTEKSRLETLLKISLWLGFLAAALGTFTTVMADKESSASKILGVIGGVAVAVAGVAATQATSGERQKVWLKCRSTGESMKSAVYLYCAAAPPFDEPGRAVTLAGLADKAIKNLDGIPLRPSDGEQPPGTMTVTDYIEQRVDDQIKYYTDKAKEFQQNADFWKYCTFGGAAISAALGAISTLTATAPWIALLATITTSFTAYVTNQHYDAMISLYETTAIRLQSVKDQWLDSHKSDADKVERGAFMNRCEETMSAENGAWLAQWSQAASAQSPDKEGSPGAPAVDATTTTPPATTN